jgi:hypothetical protein
MTGISNSPLYERSWEATLRFYREGLTGERIDNPAEWGRIFFNAWDEWVYKLAPLRQGCKLAYRKRVPPLFMS